MSSHRKTRPARRLFAVVVSMCAWCLALVSTLDQAGQVATAVVEAVYVGGLAVVSAEVVGDRAALAVVEWACAAGPEVIRVCSDVFEGVV